jgi:hypothetical protein
MKADLSGYGTFHELTVNDYVPRQIEYEPKDDARSMFISLNTTFCYSHSFVVAK